MWLCNAGKYLGLQESAIKAGSASCLAFGGRLLAGAAAAAVAAIAAAGAFLWRFGYLTMPAASLKHVVVSEFLGISAGGMSVDSMTAAAAAAVEEAAVPGLDPTVVAAATTVARSVLLLFAALRGSAP